VKSKRKQKKTKNKIKNLTGVKKLRGIFFRSSFRNKMRIDQFKEGDKFESNLESNVYTRQFIYEIISIGKVGWGKCRIIRITTKGVGEENQKYNSEDIYDPEVHSQSGTQPFHYMSTPYTFRAQPHSLMLKDSIVVHRGGDKYEATIIA